MDADNSIVADSYIINVLLLSGFIPLDILFITEGVKLIYVLFMFWDADLVSDDAESPYVQNLAILEDCGEIEYLLCDKTGTLT